MIKKIKIYFSLTQQKSRLIQGLNNNSTPSGMEATFILLHYSLGAMPHGPGGFSSSGDCIFITGNRKGKAEKVNSQSLSRSPNGILLSHFGKKLNTWRHLAVSEATNCTLLAAALPPQMKLGVLLQQRKGKILLMQATSSLCHLEILQFGICKSFFSWASKFLQRKFLQFSIILINILATKIQEMPLVALGTPLILVAVAVDEFV